MKKNVFLFFILMLLSVQAFADSQGPNSSATVVDDASVGTAAWASPSNSAASDNARTDFSSTTVLDRQSHYLKATNFGFSIPVDATINGILVSIEKSRSVGTGGEQCVDVGVRIVKGGSLGATNKALAPNWPTVDTYSDYGGAADVWGETWTAADVNSANFGVAFTAFAYFDVDNNRTYGYVDHIRITVFYTEALAAPSLKAILSNATINNAQF